MFLKIKKSKTRAHHTIENIDPARSKIAIYCAGFSRRRRADHAPQKRQEQKAQNPIMPHFPLDRRSHHQTEFYHERE